MSFTERLSRVAVIPIAPVTLAQGKRLRRDTPMRDIVDGFLSEAAAAVYDFVFLTIGSNDALKLRPRWAFGKDIRLILTALRAASPEAVLMMSSLPAFYRFELLPNPLRRNPYLHSRSLEAEARTIVASFEKAIMTPKPSPYTDGFFASDSFHPSGQGYRDWAHFAIDDAFSSGQLA